MRELRSSMRVICFFLVCLIIAVCIGYVVTVNVNGSRWVNRGNNSRIAQARKTTIQGTIYDSSGMILAASYEPGERHYTQNDTVRIAMSHTLGDQAHQTETGVEKFHASVLLGFSDTRTSYTLQRLAGNVPIGDSIVLTESAELCAYIASIFPKDKNGAVVVINYKTGAILAMLSVPGFDPANMDVAPVDSSYYNRALQKRYAPGSTFKIVTLTAALENVKNAEEATYTCQGIWNYNSNAMRCAGGVAHGDMTLETAFARSCNITFGSLAFRIGAAKLKQTAEKFGFNYDYTFDDIILYQSDCLNGTADAFNVIQAGIGQGTTQVTPLHMAMIAGAIANGGNMMEPKLISQVKSPSGSVIRSLSPAVFRTIASASVCETVARYMYTTVKSGTATRAAIPGYSGYVCGKTGSAEWSDNKDAPTHAWYTGFLLGDDEHPYAISVLVEQGGSGGSVAAPVASRVLQKAIELNLY